MPNVDPVILQLKADIADYQRDLGRAQRITDDKLDAIERRGFQMGQKLKGGFDLAKGAAVAFAGSLVVDKVFEAARAGLEYASSLGELAQQVGVTTDALQLYHYAAKQSGMSAEDMDQALTQLTRRMGEGANGTKAQAEAFQKLGIDIKSFVANGGDAGDIMSKIADGLTSLHSPAERAAVLMDLFGRSGQRLEPLLSGGAAGINDMASAYAKMGTALTPEQIKNADAAADAMGALNDRLKERVAGIVGDNAGSIIAFVEKLDRLADAAERAFRELQRLSNTPVGQIFGKVNTGLGYLSPVGALTGAISYAMDKTGGGGGSARAAPAPQKVAPGGSKFGGAFAPPPLLRKANFSGDGLDVGARSPFAFTAGGLKGGLEFAGASADKTSSQFERLNVDLAVALADLTGDIRARANAEKQRIEADKNDAIEQMKVSGDLKGDMLARGVALQEQTASARKQLVDQRAAEDLAAEERANKSEMLGMEIDALEVERNAAKHLGKRMEIERNLLALQQEEEDARLEAAIAAGDIADAAKARALLARKHGAEKSGLTNDQQGPGAAYLDGLRMDAVELNQAFESIQVEGLKNLNDGLVEAIMGTKSLGDVFKSVASQIVSDLLRIAVQRAVIEPLANALFPGKIGAGSSDGGFLSGAASAIGSFFGRASGGYVSPGQLYRVNEGSSPGNVEAFIPNGGGEIVPLGQMNRSMVQQGQGGGVVRIVVEEALGFASRVTDISANTAIEVHRVTLPGTLEAAAALTMKKAGRPSL